MINLAACFAWSKEGRYKKSDVAPTSIGSMRQLLEKMENEK